MDNSPNYKKIKQAAVIGLAVVCAFSVVSIEYTQTAEAFVCGGLCVAGIIITAGAVGGYIGWTLGHSDDDTNPNSNSEESIHHAAMLDKISHYIDLYKQNHNEQINLQNLYANTYLACVRYGENEASEVVQYDNWEEAKSNMETFHQFNLTARSILLNIMGSYGYMDSQLLNTISDSGQFSFITLKQDSTEQNYINWGIQLFNNKYNDSYLGDYLLNFVGVPVGEYIIIDGVNYSSASDYQIFDFESCDLEQVVEGTFREYTIEEISNESKVYINGVRSNYPVINLSAYDNTFTINIPDYSVDLHKTESQYHTVFMRGSPLYVGKITYSWNVADDRDDDKKKFFMYYHNGTDWNTITDHVHRADGYDTYLGEGNFNFNLNKNIYGFKFRNYYADSAYSYGDDTFSVTMSLEVDSCFFYREESTHNIELDYQTQNDIGVTDSFKNVTFNYYGNWAQKFTDMYNAINNACYAKWLYYRNQGYTSAADIPSDEMVPYPDNLMSNIDSLQGINHTEFVYMYYVLLQQYNNSDLWDSNNELSPSDFNITNNFADYMINATLVHNENIVFNGSTVWFSVTQSDLTLVKNTSYILDQQILFFDPVSHSLYFGYIGDNLTVHNITYQGEETNTVTLEITTLDALVSALYGVDIENEEDSNLNEALALLAAAENEGGYFMYIGIGCIVGGILLMIASKDNPGLSKFGLLILVLGIIVLLWVFWLQPIITGLMGGVTEGVLTILGKGWLW